MNEIKDTLTEEMEQIDAFEAQYGYDATYMKEMLRVAPEAFAVFSGFLPMAGHRQEAEINVYYTAKLTAFRQVDCGPCLQLAIRMAREAGVEASLIRDVLDPGAPLSPGLDRVHSFASAILNGTPDVDDLRAQLIEEFGEATVIELGLAVAAAQIFPVVKRATGHYQSCAVTPLDI